MAKIDWDAHRRDAEAENVDFLLGAGLQMSAVAARLGRKENTIERALERRREGGGDEPCGGVRRSDA